MSWLRTVVVVGVAVVASLLLWAIGVEPVFAVGWGLAGGAVSMLMLLTLPAEPDADAPQIPAEPDRRATEISRMAWALNPRTGLAGERITRRVRAVLRHRLQRIGLDPDAPADRSRCDARIGPELWSRLTGQNTSIADIERALDAIDRLSPTKENT